MRVLALFALPGIVLTSLLHAGVEPAPEPPRMLALSKAERVKLIAGLAEDRRTTNGTLSSR
jgi:hypothetical protein